MNAAGGVNSNQNNDDVLVGDLNLNWTLQVFTNQASSNNISISLGDESPITTSSGVTGYSVGSIDQGSSINPGSANNNHNADRINYQVSAPMLSNLQVFPYLQLQQGTHENLVLDFSNNTSSQQQRNLIGFTSIPGTVQLVFHTSDLSIHSTNNSNQDQESQCQETAEIESTRCLISEEPSLPSAKVESDAQVLTTTSKIPKLPRPKRPVLPRTRFIDTDEYGVVTWQDKLACSTCKKTFTAVASLRRHEISHSTDPKPYSCDICPRKFTQHSTLATHKKEIHEGVRDNFECHICHQKFTRGSGLKNHLKNLHTQNSSNAEGNSGVIPKEKPLRKRAMLDPFRQPEPKWHATECSVCFKKFKKARYCKRHMFIHSGERPFECQYCGKKCYRDDDLKRHIESHLDIRKYSSRYCNQKFRRKSNLNRHEKIHEENGICNVNRAYKLRTCKICKESFGSAFLFKKHFIERHERIFSVLIKRIEVKPIEMSAEQQSNEKFNLDLCTSCGNWFSKFDYRIHRILCDLDNGIVTDIGINFDSLSSYKESSTSITAVTGLIDSKEVLGNSQSSAEEQEAERVSLTPPTQQLNSTDRRISDQDLLIEKFAILENRQNPKLFKNVKGHKGQHFRLEQKHNEEEVDLKPTILDLEKSLQLCQICYEVITKLEYSEHLSLKHDKPFVVKVTKTLFKPLLRGELRSLCEVKANKDTLNIPWYLCAKCGRTFAIKNQARFHKLFHCINKDKYSVVLRQRNLTRIPAKAKLKYDIPNLQAAAVNANVNIIDRRLGTVRKEHWTENWKEDIVLNETKESYKNIQALEDGRQQCLICKKYFKTIQSIRVHMIVHREKTWICKHCGTDFTWKELFKSHLRKHTGEKPYECRICGKPYREQVARLAHEKSHLSLEEKEQAKTIRKEAQMKKRISSNSSVDPKIESSTESAAVKKEKKQFLCSICASIFSSKAGLKRHTVVIHTTDGIKPKFFECKFCSKSYSLVTSIKTHLRKEHQTQLPTLLLTNDNGLNEDNNISLNIENYFIRKNRELKRVSEMTTTSLN